MDNNKRRYKNIIRNMNLQDENSISLALKEKGFYASEGTYPLSSLHFELTSRCNAFCKHCYNNSGENNIGDSMTSEKWVEFAQYIVDHGGVFECLLSGGEPLLLGDKLFDIMDVLHDDGTIFLVMSNGQLLTRNMVMKFKKYKYHWFQISIDGAEKKYHDWFRQTDGCWEKAVCGAKMLADNGIPLKIAHCVTPYNVRDIKKACDLAYSLGASSIMIGGIAFSGRTFKNNELLLSDEDKTIMYDLIEECRSFYQGKMKVKTTNKVISGLVRHSNRPRSAAVIRPNGDIRIDGMAPFVIGNILKDDFTELWERKIDNCWMDERVKTFINGFDNYDKNQQYVNYQDEDIYL